MANIDQTKELNKLLEQQAKILAAQESSLKNQLQITQQLVAALRDLPMDEVADASAQMNKAINDAARSMEEFERGQQTTESIKKALEEAVTESDNLGSSVQDLGKKFLKLAPVVATLEGIRGGFSVLYGAMSSIVSVGGQVFSSLLQLGASIISAPFKLLNGLMSMAAQGGGSELRQAIEEVRREFGDLAHNEARAVMDAWRGINHFGGQLAETGLSIWRTMGNMAESLRALTAIAKNMGVVFSNLQDQFRGNAERIFAYVKGLHLTEEAQKGLAERAFATGTAITEMGRQITQMAFGMGDAFGINGALISRDIGEMITDFSNFGNIAIGELSEIAVYARRLGVEVKALLGVVDQFDNFEDAATSVAQLSQAFGLQLDTLNLLSEQNPAQRIEQLRKAFFAAGRSVENMTRQERALLAQQTGLDQNTLSLVFSQQNASRSYEEIQKQSEATEKQQISQAEAMQKLAGSIERLVKSGGALQGGFFDIFIQGFLRGIRWTREFRHLMVNLRHAMRAIYFAGVQVGRIFVDLFPGVKSFLTGVAGLFDRRRWRTMASGIVDIFRNFFTSLTKGSKTAVADLLANLQTNFMSAFGGTTGDSILSGLRDFGKAFVTILTQAFSLAVEALTDFIRGIANGSIFKAVGSVGASATSGLGGILSDIFQPVMELFTSPDGDFWKSEGGRLIKGLGEALLELMKKAWEYLQPILVDFLSKNWHIIFAVLFGPSIIGGLIRGISTGLGSALIGGLSGGLNIFTRGAGGMIGSALTKVGVAGSPSAVASGARSASIAGTAAGGLANTIEQLNRTRISGRALANMALLGTILTVGMIAIVEGLVMLAHQIKDGGLSAQNIAVAGLAMVSAGLVMIELAGVTSILSKVSAGIQPSQLIKGILAVGAVGAALAFGMVGLIELFRGITPNEIMITLGAMSAAALMVLEVSLVVLTLAGIGSLSQSLAGQIVVGIIAIGLVGAAMAAGVIGLIELFKGYSESKINNTVNIMNATSLFFMAASAVTGVAAAIGTAIVATYGIGAAVVLAGLATLGGVILAMTEITAEVIEQVNRFNLRPGTERRLDVFVKIIGAIGQFAANVAPIIEATSPGFSDLIREGPAMTQKLASVGELVRTMGTEMRSTITELVTQANNLEGDEGSLQKAQILASLMESLGEMAVSLRPSDQFLDVGFWESLTGDTVAGRLQQLTTYMRQVFSSIRSTVSTIVREFNTIATSSGFTTESANAAKAIGEIIVSVGQLGRAMTIFISREYATTDPSVLRRLAPQLGNVIEAIMSGIIGSDGNNLFSRMADVIGYIVSAVRGLSRRELDAVKTASPVIQAAFTAMSAIAALIGNVGLGEAVRGTPGQTKEQVDQLVRLVNAITYGLGNNIGNIIRTLAESFRGLSRSEAQQIKTGLEAVGQVFTSISTITDLSNSFQGDSESMATAGARLSDFLGALEDFISGRGQTGVLQFAQRLPTWLNAIGSQANPIYDALPDFADTLRYINTTAVAIDRIFNSEVMQNIGNIEEAGIARIQTGVTAMINNINEFGDALRGIKGVNINTELQALNDRLGLRSTGTLTVRQQPVVLNINFTVTMDSEDLETALINRPGRRLVIDSA